MKPNIQIYILTCILGLVKGNLDRTQIKPDYKFEYYVRDERTGDFKTQEEKRIGDYLSGSYSVGEPNGDLRVVTYNADHKNGFNAHVQIQPGGSPVNSNFRNKDKHLEDIMKLIPRYQMRTGFPPLDIKIIPPKLSSTTTEMYTIQEPDDEEVREDGVETLLPLSNFTDISNRTDSIEGLNQSKETGDVNLTSVSEQSTGIAGDLGKSEGCDLCTKTVEDGEEEGRAHIKPHEDRVQLEMEQVIRAEMQEPTGISLGVPYQQHESNQQTGGNKNYLMKPMNIDLKPLVNEEEIMLVGGSSIKQEALNTPLNAASYLNEGSVFMLPYSVNGPRAPSSSRYPDMGRALFAHPLRTSRPAKPTAHPLFTTGLAFILLPRP